MSSWHEFHCSLFGNKIPTDMAAAWTGVWTLKGFSNELLLAAVAKVASMRMEDIPEWPLDHIKLIARLSGQILIDRALAGRLEAKESMLALSLAEEEFKSAQDVAKKKCIGFSEWDPEKGLPEAKKFHQAKAVLESLKKRNSAAALGVKAEVGTNAEAVAKVREISSLIGRSIS